MNQQESANIVLRRCQKLNCLYEGQSFSLNIMANDLGGRQNAAATMASMEAAGLVAVDTNGVYVLTRKGAEAIGNLAPITAPAKKGAWQPPRKNPPRQE